MSKPFVNLVAHYRPEPQTIAYRVAALIDATGRGVGEISFQATGSPNAIRDLLRRKCRRWRPSIVLALAKTLRVTPEYLYTGEGSKAESAISLLHRSILQFDGPWLLWKRGNVVTYEILGKPRPGDYVLLREGVDEIMDEVFDRGPFRVLATRSRDGLEPKIKIVPSDSLDNNASWVRLDQCYLIVSIASE